MKPSEDRTSENSRSRLETHWGVERRDAQRKEDECGGGEVKEMAGEPGEVLLKTFWLATSKRRL